MPLDVHVIDKALSVQTMIIQNKYKQQTVIQLNENHRPNIVYKSYWKANKKYAFPCSKQLSNTPS